MVASTGKTGKGVSFQVALVASPLVWVTVANVRSINRSGQQADEIDFTHLLSDGSFREFRQGFKDGGTVGVDFHFDPTEDSHAGTNGLQDLFTDGTIFNWRINFAGAGWAFALRGLGFVTNPGDISIDVDGPITGSATVRNTGETTLEAVV